MSYLTLRAADLVESVPPGLLIDVPTPLLFLATRDFVGVAARLLLADEI